MSRHRNIRNLTEDDYYDDYDDYDDDYYEEEAYDDSEYKPPPRTQPTPIVAQVKPRSEQHHTPKQKQPEQSDTNKLRLLEGMGFSKDQATAALTKVDGNVQHAVDMLLKGDLPIPSKSGITKPPVGFSPPPPPSVKKQSISVAPPTCDPKKGPHVGFVDDQKDKLSKSVKAMGSNTSTRDFGPLPKLPSELHAKLLSQKSRLAMVVVGHVDAGKSTLMGQVMVQLGYVGKRAVQKYQKQATDLGKGSFALAWVMDEDDAERERGVTMDIATKAISTTVHDFVILDAPGHADFVPSMITGAAAADVGILVVASTPGEFEAGFDGGGQTREHIILARGLGVSQLIVAINKLDCVDWSENRFHEIRTKIEPFLLQCGFISKRLQFIPISGLTGANVKSKDGATLLYSWYHGVTLLEAMDNFSPAKRSIDKPLRIIVNDVYAEGNKGVSIRCRVVQGVLQVGEKVVTLPIGDEAIVAKIEHSTSASEIQHKYAMAGDTIEASLQGIDIARIMVGGIISHPHLELRPPLTRKVKARIMVMEQLTVPLIRGVQVLLHMHSIDLPAVITKLLASADPRTKNSQKVKPRALCAGVTATVEVTFAAVIAVEPYTECRSLGRFVLRRSGETVAIGIVEQTM